jgi:hypothetical protein
MQSITNGLSMPEVYLPYVCSAFERLKHFCRSVIECLGPDYMCRPTIDDFMHLLS